mgnify:CR=1 FL=1|jgi:uncharacterized protein (DUF2267 family)
MNIPRKLQSRKLAVAFVGLIVQVLAVWISPEQAQQIGTNLMVIVSAYLVAQGVADHGK